jgi:tRNA-specific 2-thiouridylase
MILPLTRLSKESAKEIVSCYGVNIKKLPHSRDLCFVSEKSIADFLKNTINPVEGELFLKDGVKLGSHPAIEGLTVGQRKGLNIPFSEPLYVIDVDISSKRAILGNKEHLLRDDFPVFDVHFVSGFTPPLPYYCTVSLRNTHAGIKASIPAQRKTSFE